MTYLLLFGAGALLPATDAQAACEGRPGNGAVRLDIVATEVRNVSGEVAFTIYPNDSSRFLAKRGKLLRARVPARSPRTEACFWLPPGTYAAAIYHDENGDRHFNRTLFSVKEGFGFSNDAPTTLGLPSLSDARFDVRRPVTTLRIRMRYKR